LNALEIDAAAQMMPALPDATMSASTTILAARCRAAKNTPGRRVPHGRTNSRRANTGVFAMKKALILAFLIPFAVGPSLPVAGQDINIGDFEVANPNPLPVLEYAVKFVCGKPENPVVAPGIYFTAINVHNPRSVKVNFVKKIAVALPSEKAGPVTRFFRVSLDKDSALEIDCPDILKHADQKDFLKGFVIVRTNYELDVVAVYTAAGSTGSVETLFMERVSPRRL
jgi:hypothetical protein